MPPTISVSSPRVRSRAFQLWKEKEKAEGRKITQDEIVDAVRLARMTVRRFLEPGGDVTGSSLSSVAAFARYFGVGISDVVEMVEAPTADPVLN